MSEDDYCQDCADRAAADWVHHHPDIMRLNRQKPHTDATTVEQTYLIEYACRGCESHPEAPLRGTCYMFAPSKWCPLERENEGYPKWEAEIL